MIDRFRVVPAAYVILRRDDEVLLQLRRGTGYMDEHWACGVAGHVERDESVFAAACREAHEEVGITIAPSDLKPLTTMHRTHAGAHWVDERVDFFFTCTTWQGEPTLQEPDRAADLEWFPLNQLPTPVVPHELAVLSALAAGAVSPMVTYGFPDAVPQLRASTAGRPPLA